MSGIHVRSTYHTDPQDPDGPCMYRLEVWPIPQEAVPGLNILLEAAAKDYLRRIGLAGDGEKSLADKVGPH